MASSFWILPTSPRTSPLTCRAQAEFMAHAQMPTAAKVFSTPITNPAWKLKPSWYMVAKSDKTINPDLERLYAERAKSHKAEVGGASHAVYISHPKEVAALIEEAVQKSAPQTSLGTATP